MGVLLPMTVEIAYWRCLTEVTKPPEPDVRVGGGGRRVGEVDRDKTTLNTIAKTILTC